MSSTASRSPSSCKTPQPAVHADVLGRKIATVKRVLLTGMSGTGKSSVIQALSARGFKAVDTDDGWCEPLPDGRQRWREGAIGQLPDTADDDVVFVPGGAQTRAPVLLR